MNTDLTEQLNVLEGLHPQARRNFEVVYAAWLRIYGDTPEEWSNPVYSMIELNERLSVLKQSGFELGTLRLYADFSKFWARDQWIPVLRPHARLGLHELIEFPYDDVCLSSPSFAQRTVEVWRKGVVRATYIYDAFKAGPVGCDSDSPKELEEKLKFLYTTQENGSSRGRLD